MNEYVVDIVDIREYIPRSCTLAQSHRLAFLLEPTGNNLLASGVQTSKVID